MGIEKTIAAEVLNQHKMDHKENLNSFLAKAMAVHVGTRSSLN